MHLAIAPHEQRPCRLFRRPSDTTGHPPSYNRRHSDRHGWFPCGHQQTLAQRKFKSSLTSRKSL
jgi:hypothetical protein